MAWSHSRGGRELHNMKIDPMPLVVTHDEVPGRAIVCLYVLKAQVEERLTQLLLCFLSEDNVKIRMWPCLLAQQRIDAPATA